MQNFREELIIEAKEQKITITDSMACSFEKYFDMLVEWNEKINLTAITKPQEVITKHFVDSLLLSRALPLDTDKKLIDIGTGAGFPGIPLLIHNDKLQLSLLDALLKRTVFLEKVLAELSLHAEVIHGRAEELGRKKEYRGFFDFVTSRAVAKLSVLCEYAIPLLKQGGVFAAMKGPNIEAEIEASKNALSLLGAEIEEVKSFELGENIRNIILIRKVTETQERFPRSAKAISRKGL